MYSEEQYRKIKERLEKLSFHGLEYEKLSQQNDNKTHLADIRSILEEFFREAVDVAYHKNRLQFRGDREKFSETRVFICKARWITAHESHLIASFYSLLSEIVHEGNKSNSKISVAAASHFCWYIFDLVSERITNPIKIDTNKGKRERSPVDYLVIARNFLNGIKQNKHEGDAYEVNFNKEFMDVTRQIIEEEDIPTLLEVLNDATSNLILRSRIAHLLICTCVKENESLKARTVEQMNNFYWKNRNVAPWQVLRGVSMALSNQTNNSDCILDYVEWIQKKI